MNIIQFYKSTFCAFLVAITYIFGKKLGNSSSPEVWALLRFVISTLCFLPFINLKECKKLRLANGLLILFASFFGVFLYNTMLFLAIKQSSPINISLVNATIPLLTLALASMLNRNLPTKKQSFAFFVSFIGAVLVITKGNFSTNLLQTSTGEMLMVLGACSWVLYGFFIRSITKDFSPLFTTFITGFIGTFMLFAFAFHNKTLSSVYYLTQSQWFYIGYIGSIGTALVFFMYSQIIQKTGPTFVNLVFFTLTPVFVTLISYFFLAIPLNIWQIFGGFCVLGALVIQVK